MPTVDAVAECPVYDSFRVQQVAGMFDVPLAERIGEKFSVELPERDEPWQIGLIVGPSGSGKSTIARTHFGDAVYGDEPWPTDRAVIDGFGDLPTKQITSLLTAVGFSSPPSWIKPYQVLSRGEQFRCNLARALSRSMCRSQTGKHQHRQLSPKIDANSLPPSSFRPPPSNIIPHSPLPIPHSLVVYDEFTSVVDRNVARICSAAVWNVSLDESEMKMLAAGYSPYCLTHRVSNLVFYHDLLRRLSRPGRGPSLTATGTAVEPHPRQIISAPPQPALATIVPKVGGPFCAERGEVWTPTAAVGQVVASGAERAEVFSTGVAAGEVHC